MRGRYNDGKNKKAAGTDCGLPAAHVENILVAYLPSHNMVRGQLFLRCLDDVRSLRSLLTLSDFELDLISFLQALITFRADRAIMNKDIRPIGTSDESVAFRVVKPLYCASQAFHEPLFPHILTRT